MIMENDFSGYGYPSLAAAIRVLTSHELFHAVQRAYSADDLDVWLSEGTAVWAELLYDADSQDFFAFADAYLEDVGRSLDRPPVGPVPAFAYGTCLFFEHMTERLGTAAMVTLLEQTASLGAMDAVEATIVEHDATLQEEWIAFTDANLATGSRAGLIDAYPFAAELRGVDALAKGDSIHDDNRFFPLAATYYFLSHKGGALWFASLDDPTGIDFALFPVPDGGDSNPVAAAVATWAPAGGAANTQGDFPAGDYWLRGTYAARAEQSIKIEFCLGSEAAIASCVPPTPDGGASDGASDADDSGDGGGCGCVLAGASTHTPWWPTFLVVSCLVLCVVRSRRLG